MLEVGVGVMVLGGRVTVLEIEVKEIFTVVK